MTYNQQKKQNIIPLTASNIEDAKKNKIKNVSLQEENFIKKYLKTQDAITAYLFAFPEEKNVSEKLLRCRSSRLLKQKRIVKRLNELKNKYDSAFSYSLDLNKRKLLEKAITMLEECDNKAERGHAVNILKMLFQKEGMLQQNNNTINVNIANNTVISDVSKFLDL